MYLCGGELNKQRKQLDGAHTIYVYIYIDSRESLNNKTTNTQRYNNRKLNNTHTLFVERERVKQTQKTMEQNTHDLRRETDEQHKQKLKTENKHTTHTIYREICL